MTRRLPLVIAAALFLTAFSVEIGARWFTGAEEAPQREAAATAERIGDAESPGLGIPAMALIDGLILLGIALMALGELSPRTLARTGAIAVLASGIVVIVVGIILALIAVQKLMLMIGLLMTPLFGQALYLGLFGDFPVGAANATLGLLMALRIGGGVALVVWSRAVLQAKGLILLILTALLAGTVVSFLHGMVPRVLASVTDAVAAIIVCILAIVWGVVQVVSGAISLLKVVSPS